MTRTLSTLVLSTLVTLAACDTTDGDVAEASPRDKVLYTDAASLEALVESDSEIQDVVAAQLELDGDRLLDMALDPAASPDLVLTAPPSPSMSSSSCVTLNEVLDFCYNQSGNGVHVWVEVLGVSSPLQYLSFSGACVDDELDVAFASVDYTICTAPVPFPQVVIGAETCVPGVCEDVAYVEIFD